MKFLIKDNPISYDEIYGSIIQYTRENHGKWPSYILLHPETRHKILISERDAEQGMQFRVVNHSIKSIHEGLTTTTQVFGMSLIQTYDVEPGFIIICG